MRLSLGFFSPEHWSAESRRTKVIESRVAYIRSLKARDSVSSMEYRHLLLAVTAPSGRHYRAQLMLIGLLREYKSVEESLQYATDHAEASLMSDMTNAKGRTHTLALLTTMLWQPFIRHPNKRHCRRNMTK